MLIKYLKIIYLTHYEEKLMSIISTIIGLPMPQSKFKMLY